jgi:hypothetical protein
MTEGHKSQLESVAPSGRLDYQTVVALVGPGNLGPPEVAFSGGAGDTVRPGAAMVAVPSIQHTWYIDELLNEY